MIIAKYSSRGIVTNIHEPEANNCFSIITQVIIEYLNMEMLHFTTIAATLFG